MPRDKDPERKVWVSKIRTMEVVRGRRGMGIRGGMGNREGGRKGRKERVKSREGFCRDQCW